MTQSKETNKYKSGEVNLEIRTPTLNDGLDQILRAVRANKKLYSHAPKLQASVLNIDRKLSFQQNRLWFYSELEPDNSAHNSIRAYRMNGSLNLSSLEEALNEIIRRHEIFRTTFCIDSGEVRQFTCSDLHLDLQLSDLQAYPESEQDSVATSFSRELAVQPIDLTQGPILRALVFQLNPESCILLLLSHNIIFDFRSWELFNEELSSLYSTFSQGRPSELVDPKLQYSDFSNWQKNWLRGEALHSLKSYWKRQLSKKYYPIHLPFDHPRPSDQADNRADLQWSISKNVTDGLKMISAQHCVTLYVTLLAGINVLFSRYAESRDVLIFSPTSGRTQLDLQKLIGPISNTLCLRTNLSGDPKFAELMHRVRDVVLGAYANQDLPFEQILQTLPLDKDAKEEDLYQIRFIFLSNPAPPLVLSGLTLEPLVVNNESTKFDIELLLEDGGGELKGSFTYNKLIFEASTIERMLDNLLCIFLAMVNNSEQAISVPELSGVEKDEGGVLKDIQEPRSSNEILKIEYTPESQEEKSLFLHKPDSNDFVEHMLRQIWLEVLDVSEIGNDDNFFDISGSSLKAMQILARIEETFGKTLPVAVFTEKPTISALIKRISDDSLWTEKTDLIPVQPNGEKKPFFFVFGDAAYLSNYLDAEQPFYWFTRWPTRLRLAKAAIYLPKPSIHQIAAEYVENLRQVQPTGPYLIGGACAGGIVAFEIAQQLKEMGEEVSFLALFDLPDLKHTGNAPLTNRVDQNLIYLRSLNGITAKLGYVLRKGVAVIANRRLFNSNVRTLISKLLIQYYVLFGRPMPLELTRKYTHYRIVDALLDYQYHPYNGPVDLFFSEEWISSEEQDYNVPDESEWYKTLRGLIEVHKIPGCTHHEIFHSPYIQPFAKVINRSLVQRQK